jgi:hypothetical protein
VKQLCPGVYILEVVTNVNRKAMMLLYLVLTGHRIDSVNEFMALARLNGYFVLVQSAVLTNTEL